MILTPKDFTYDWFSGTGAGGQHRNKHQNCLRLTHNETGIRVVSQSNRSRRANKRIAYEEMACRLKNHYSSDTVKVQATDTIKSYKIEDGFVIDHRIEHKTQILSLDDYDFSVKVPDVILSENK